MSASGSRGIMQRRSKVNARENVIHDIPPILQYVMVTYFPAIAHNFIDKGSNSDFT